MTIKKTTRLMNRITVISVILTGIIFIMAIAVKPSYAADSNKLVMLPSIVTGDSAAGFDGGTCPAPYSDVDNIDIVNAFIGKDRESYFVAIPSGRYITFSFPDSIHEIKDATLTIETTGADKATCKVSAVLNDNKEQVLGSVRETQETQLTTFSLDQDCILDLKAIIVTGTNNAGKYPGADVVSIYIEYTESDNLFFDAQGGVADYGSKRVEAGDTYGTLPNAQKTGYTLKGWYTKESGGSKITSDTVKKSGIITLYARWKENKYNIKFDKNGGSGSMKSMKKLQYREKYKLTANKFKRSGYVFLGWSTSKKGSVVFANKAYVRKLTSTNGETITLYAIWQKKTKTKKYNVEFYPNGGKGKKTTKKNIKYGKVYKLKSNTFKRSGYTFVGWSKTKKGTVQYGNAEPVINLTSKNGGTVKLYAVWVKNTDKDNIKKEKDKVPEVYGCIISGCNDRYEGHTINGATDLCKKLKKNTIPGYINNSKNIKLYGVGQPAPYKFQIDNFIKESFKETTDKDISIVFYAGHGRGGGSNGNGLGICTLDDNWAGYYSYADLLDLLDKSIKGKIVLIVDSCYSGGFTEAVKASSIKDRICIMASSSVNEVSDSTLKVYMADEGFPPLQIPATTIAHYVDKKTKGDSQYQCFTYTLMEGVNWQKKSNYPADINKDRTVTCEELYAYINSTLSKWSAQTPKCYLGKLKSQIVFSY